MKKAAQTDGHDSVLDALFGAVSVIDRDGRICDWNKSAQNLYGWTRAEALGARLDDLVPQNHAAEFESTGESPNEELITRQVRTGEIRHIASTRIPKPNEPERLMIFERDVSREISLRKRRTLADARYRTMFETMPIGFVESDFSALGAMLIEMFESGTMDVRKKVEAEPDFLDRLIDAPIMVDLNPEAMRIYGARDRSELVGRPISTTLADKSAFLHGVYVSTQDDQTVHSAEMLSRRLDGTAVEIHHSIYLSPETKKNFTTFASHMELTSLKAAEREAIASQERYRNVFESMPVAFLSLDWTPISQCLSSLRTAGVADLIGEAGTDDAFLEKLLSLTQVVDANETAVAMLGGQTREDLLGDVARYWPEASRSVFLDAVNNGYLGRARFEAQTRLASINGREIDVIFTAIAPRSGFAAGSIIIGIVDISDLLATRAAAERLQEELSHAGRVSVLGELTASIAHEVNQPLAAITTNGQASLRWLSQPDIDIQEIQALTARMVEGAYRAADIIGRIRAMAAKRAPVRGLVSINAIVDDALIFLRHELQASQVVLSLDLARDLPMIDADRTQLQQVIVNLAMNALQAMTVSPTAPHHLAIETRQSSDNLIAVAISDNGPGIDPDHLDRLFDSFFTTKENGLGIGLPITRSIVEAHGGRIEAENNPDGVGARFTFSVSATL